MAYNFQSTPTHCAVCGTRIEQSNKQGRVKKYCSNRCKMKARAKRGYVDRYHFGDNRIHKSRGRK